jgi:hypothetical protein
MLVQYRQEHFNMEKQRRLMEFTLFELKLELLEKE